MGREGTGDADGERDCRLKGNIRRGCGERRKEPVACLSVVSAFRR